MPTPLAAPNPSIQEHTEALHDECHARSPTRGADPTLIEANCLGEAQWHVSPSPQAMTDFQVVTEPRCQLRRDFQGAIGCG
jgi:hypothetical protein